MQRSLDEELSRELVVVKFLCRPAAFCLIFTFQLLCLIDEISEDFRPEWIRLD
jgi:hypothetical protein